MDNRPRLKFKHDVSESIGRVFGPNGSGKEFVTMESVDDNGDGTFTATYRYATTDDLANEQIVRLAETNGTRD